jgi:ribose transport system substrate-binding protein
MKKTLIVLLLLALIITIPGQVFSQGKGILIGIAARGLYDDFAVAMQTATVKRAQELGATVITVNAMLDPQLQMDQLDTLATLGVKAVVLTPQDSKAIIPAIEKLNAKGIYVITQDVAPAGGKVALHIAVDNAAAGEKAGTKLVELLKQRFGKPQGTVLEIMGDLRHDVTGLRSEGFHRAIDKYPDITVIKKPADWDANKAFDITKDTLSAQGDKLVGIYLHSDIYSPGVFPAIKAANRDFGSKDRRHIFVVSIDGQPIGLEMIRQGKMDQTSVQPATDYGTLAAEWAIKFVNGEQLPPAGNTIEKQGELWSPATVGMLDVGPALYLNTPRCPGDVDPSDPRLWGNARK